MSNDPANPNNQHLLTAILEATAESVQFNRQNGQMLNHLTQEVAHLTVQVGHLTEGLVEIKYLVQEQAETSKRQERNIDRLVGIVDHLIQERP